VSTVHVWIDDETLGGATLAGSIVRSTSKTGDVLRFQYSDGWLNDAGPIAGFALDTDLVLATGPLYAQAGAAKLSGIFMDCSPDRWGKMLMERREAIEAKADGRRVRTLHGWDFLLGVNDASRMGAVRLQDADSGQFLDARALGAPPVTDLLALEAAADKVERGSDADVARWIEQLIAPGASLGGARPKAGFRDTEGRLWLAKFPSAEDRHDVGLWEFFTCQLSLAAGIDMPPARVLKLSARGHTYAVQRFDRTSTSRRLYASAMTRLGRIDSDGASYLDIVQTIESGGPTSRIATDLEQLFRRALFNILIGNRDDHLRNHGFLREGNGWALSPAFDVNPNPDKTIHVLAINEADASPDSVLLMSTAEFYRLKPTRAGAIERQVRNALRGWEAKAKAMGVKRAEIDQMGDVIDADR
jgi:serine/threonine-protein kinase HipA